MSFPDAHIVIPARMGGQRFPDKVMAEVNGKPLLEWTWQQAVSTGYPVTIVTDSHRVIQHAMDVGMMHWISSEATCGMDRVHQFATGREGHCPIWIDWQVDEPCVAAQDITKLVNSLKYNTSNKAASLMTPLSAEDALDPNNVKVAVDSACQAVYFSRQPIPSGMTALGKHLLHVGIYAIRSDVLSKDWPCNRVGALERQECLEQLRVVDQAWKWYMVPCAAPPVAINTPSDLMKAQSYLKD